ncbi:hypothetical protein BaRGS_00015987 [Batillaria attramentaria]|uniref:Sulfotransferase domain-containing protein n=1 Tax=Batillaria attramentaria TaxID=370345 RepID=A0ABD0L188_9CAEN
MTTVHVTDRAGCTMRLVDVDGRKFPDFPVENLTSYQSVPLREDDVILCAYPKSGTHWLWEVCMMLLRGVSDTIPFKKSLQMLEFNSADKMAEYESPRVLNTHVLYDRLPSDAYKLKTKLVLVLRNPKDVAVSFYNHHMKLEKYYQYKGKFSDWLQLFLEGQVDYGSWFDYVRSWEKVINSDVKNPIHDPVRETRRLAEFLGVTPDPELVKSVAAKCDFSRMANDKKEYHDHQLVMFRKGIVGDWKNQFTVAEDEVFNATYAEKMKGSKLQFRFTLR